MKYPTHIVHSVAGIDPERFCEQNPWLGAMSYDRDGTLTDYHSPTIPRAHLEVLRGFADLGIVQGFNSNAGVRSWGKLLHVANVISEAIGAEFFAATSSEAHGKKPGKKTFELFAEKSGVALNKTVHVGDQWFKDILGAERAGLGGAILVARYGEGDDWRVRYLQRPIVEFSARIAMGLPGQVHNFPPLLERAS